MECASLLRSPQGNKFALQTLKRLRQKKNGGDSGSANFVILSRNALGRFRLERCSVQQARAFPLQQVLPPQVVPQVGAALGGQVLAALTPRVHTRPLLHPL